MRCKRTLESPSKTTTRREQVRTHIAKKRALENQSETMARREQDRTYSAKKRALEIQVNFCQEKSKIDQIWHKREHWKAPVLLSLDVSRTKHTLPKREH